MDDVEFVPLVEEGVALLAQLGVVPAQLDVDRASTQNGTHGDQGYDHQRPDDRALCKCHETHFKCHGGNGLTPHQAARSQGLFATTVRRSGRCPSEGGAEEFIPPGMPPYAISPLEVR
ncbi:hypothetical protein GCM10010231_07120 [Streptomyces sindenensis]|nr:hypothetical protein GCM10010231_07120 [Streptomyces sindenensis]